MLLYAAQRICYQNGSWDALINVNECQSAELDVLYEKVEDLSNSVVINIADLSAISTELSDITNTSGITATRPENLNTTNNILNILIRLVHYLYIHIHIYIYIYIYIKNFT